LTVSRSVLICQSKTCRKQDAAKVLAAFKAHPIADVSITASGCLGQCGNGPMVLVLPDEVWYGEVHPDEVRAVVEHHFRQGQPVQTLLYRKKRKR
jgi:(2Fe-2S) ferredoxin